MKCRSIILLIFGVLAITAPGLFAAQSPLTNVRVTKISVEAEHTGTEWGVRDAHIKYMRFIDLIEKRQNYGLTRAERIEAWNIEKFLRESPSEIAVGLLGAADPISACRVVPKPVGFPGVVLNTRTLNAAPFPPLQITIDACIASLIKVAVENLTNDNMGSAQWVHADINFRASFGSTFDENAVFLDSFVLNRTVGFIMDPYDGTFDFAGLSGTRHENIKQALVTIQADVSDPSFFTSPFDITVEMTSPGGIVTFHSGHTVSEFDQFGAAGIVFHFNGIAPP